MRSEHLGPTKQHPTEWEREFGFRIVDPDGWRNRGLDFHREISADAFMLMAMESTIEIKDRARLLDSGVIDLPKDNPDV